MVAGLVVALLAPTTTAAAQTTEPQVSVAPGPSTEGSYAPECNDIVLRFPESTSFVLERDGDTDTELTVSYEATGTARPGDHYEALPGEVVLEAGEPRATVDVEVLPGDATELVELRLRVLDGDRYRPGTPEDAAIQFVRPRDPSLPRPECGFSFAEGERIVRTIELATTPQRIVVEQLTPPIVTEVPPEGYRMRVAEGALPPGLSLGEDGRFSGGATEAGSYEAVVEACRTTPPGTCIEATLVVTVAATSTTDPATADLLTADPPTADPATASNTPPTSRRRPSSATTIPETGAEPTTTAGAGVVLTGLGLVVASLARRRSALHPSSRPR